MKKQSPKKVRLPRWTAMLFFLWAFFPIAHAQTPETKVFEEVGSSRVDLQACKLEYSIVSPK